MEYNNLIETYIEKEIRVLKALDTDAISRVINVLEEARCAEADIYVCGNGGSASTAGHLAGDFNKGVSQMTSGKKYRMHCLTDNLAAMTAISNDFSYDDVFLKQLEGRLRKSDLLIAISGSGNSVNIIKAAEYAKSVGCKVIGMTGYDGGKLKQMADYHLDVCCNDMQISEDVHLVFDHLMMSVLIAAGESKE
ncbi:MAG: SIS domain-containing protein [Lachnospiraceae bacterium]|nr:SIS domain-containing protein [Lachnospiraceae bacterium]